MFITIEFRVEHALHRFDLQYDICTTSTHTALAARVRVSDDVPADSPLAHLQAEKTRPNATWAFGLRKSCLRSVAASRG
jgi:hypothetical protein